eukprot:CAMPEP_0197293910 /NCGR_PEP_ID=MMETSP0890-20130614/30385_1 /TAXON_ID=44058 ORGANISM="Aureoumbra lagunensis, Strain CCMP1510" /NCGR_SAMPLE_ID=MMETSP0890 /ASSEMBLY_ACC=CAM_ASM_000533 /LENGTH=234 /DNA_ID=CAMNT_0042768995 /DNA_START=40 /DNA_END=741 /DNA_ORIENTATION=-
MNAAASARFLSHVRGESMQPGPLTAKKIKSNVLPGILFTFLAFLTFLITTIHAIIRLRRNEFGPKARKRWERCENSANSKGKWLKDQHGCDWNNQVQLHYKSHSNLADATLANTEHVLIFASVLTLLFLLVLFGICLAYFGAGTSPHPVVHTAPEASCLDCDCLRLRPRLLPNYNAAHYPLVTHDDDDDDEDDDDIDDDINDDEKVKYQAEEDDANNSNRDDDRVSTSSSIHSV